MTFHSFDADYIERLRTGDRNLQEHFAVYFGEAMYGKLCARLRSRESFEDIIQETLTRVLVYLYKGTEIRQPERFGALVNKFCDNVVREYLRRAKRPEVTLEEAGDPADPVCGRDQTLIRDEIKQRVRLVLKKMTRRERDALRALYLEEIDKAEVCRTYHLSEDYLRVVAKRAREQFRKLYTASSARRPLDIGSLRKKAESGNAVAQTNLGSLYLHGIMVEKNYPKALKLLSQAAEQGSASAAFHLGRMHEEGLGTGRNLAEGLRLYRIAAEANLFEAQVQLGRVLSRNGGGVRDHQEALKWYRAAAAHEGQIDDCAELDEVKGFLTQAASRGAW